MNSKFAELSWSRQAGLSNIDLKFRSKSDFEAKRNRFIFAKIAMRNLNTANLWKAKVNSLRFAVENFLTLSLAERKNCTRFASQK